MHIAVDFDGTLFSGTNFPDVGLPIFKNIDKVKTLKKQGHILILWTCRSGQDLENAVQACKSVGLDFDYVNENDPARIAYFDNDSRKVGADVYIDDRSVRPEEIDKILNEQEHIWKQIW